MDNQSTTPRHLIDSPRHLGEQVTPCGAKDFLDQALSEMIDRETKYDQEGGERSMDKTMEIFRALTGIEMSVRQGWLFMVILKMVRAEYNGYRKDDYVDLAAYVALMGESASAGE